MESEIGTAFKITRKLDFGGFGEIFHAISMKNNKEVAIKIEKVNKKRSRFFIETLFYDFLLSDSSAIDKGIPNIYCCGKVGEHNVIVMELLGCNLEQLLMLCNNRFSLKTVLMLADQMLSILEYLHNKNYLHRDIKPENFLMGKDKKSHIVHIIDFGFAKRLMRANGKHVCYRQGRNFMGTARYGSINNHLGTEQSRRDDLESLGYIFIYFLRGVLPWQNLEEENKYELLETIMNIKIMMPVELLCIGLPKEFATYLHYCRYLRYDEIPDYSYLKNLFKDLFLKLGFENDYMYDWVLKFQEDKFMDVSSTNLQKNEKTNRMNAKPANGNQENISNNIDGNSSQINKTKNDQENKHDDKTKDNGQ